MDINTENTQEVPEVKPPETKQKTSKFKNFFKSKRNVMIAVVALLLITGSTTALFLHNNNARKNKKAASLTENSDGLDTTYYTGIKEDVLTNQTFDCKPRNDHEWYRTDRTLVVDYKDPNTMYISVEYKGVFKTTDGGKSWIQKTKGIKVYARADDKTKGCYSEYPVIRMDPTNNRHLVIGLSGGGGGFLDATTPNTQTGGVYQSFDGGDSW
jgi:hypothetical protein